MKQPVSLLLSMLLLPCFIPPAKPASYLHELCSEDLLIKIIHVCGKKSWRVHVPKGPSQAIRDSGDSEKEYVKETQRMLDNDRVEELQPLNRQQMFYNDNDRYELVLDVRAKRHSKILLAHTSKITPRQFRHDEFSVLKQCCNKYCSIDELTSKLC